MKRGLPEGVLFLLALLFVLLVFGSSTGMFIGEAIHGVAPSGQTLLFYKGFEDGSLQPLYSIEKPWSVVNNEKLSGSYSAKSASMSNSQKSHLVLDLDVPVPEATLTFARKISSEQGYDFLRFYIDDIEVDQWSGELDWKSASYFIPNGTHTFRWSYEKDMSRSSGQDSAWIDDINVTTSTQFATPELLTLYEIPIDLTSNVSVQDHQVKIVLNNPVTIQNIRLLGSDFRVFDHKEPLPYFATDGKLPYWTESLTSYELVLWVKVDTLPVGTKRIYLYYGGGAQSESSVQNTFIRQISDVRGSWKFDNGAGDTSGNNNHGTVNGATVASGKYGEALAYDGIDDYVQVPSSSTLDMSSMTVEAWIKPDVINESAIITKNSFSNVLGWGLWIDHPNSTVDNSQFMHYHYSGTNKEFSGSRGLSASTWAHLLVIYDGSSMRLYLNGQLDGSHSYSNGITEANGKSVRIGTTNGKAYDGNPYFDGVIDEVKIYGKALSAAEALDVYRNEGYTTVNYPGYVLVKNPALQPHVNVVGENPFLIEVLKIPYSLIPPVTDLKDQVSGLIPHLSDPNGTNPGEIPIPQPPECQIGQPGCIGGPGGGGGGGGGSGSDCYHATLLHLVNYYICPRILEMK